MPVTTTELPTVLVVDFGSASAQALARQVRDCGVYSEVVPRSWTTERLLGEQPACVIIAGDLASLEPTLEEPGPLDFAALAEEFPVVLADNDDFLRSLPFKFDGGK